MKKGFTLVEELGIIIILAIIFLILTPVVSGVIKSADKRTFKESIIGILDSADTYINAKKTIKYSGPIEYPIVFICDGTSCKNEIDDTLSFSGKIPLSGKVIIISENSSASFVTNGKWCASGIKDDLEIASNCNLLDHSDPEINTDEDITLVSTTNSILVSFPLNLMYDIESGISKYDVSLYQGDTLIETREYSEPSILFENLTKGLEYRIVIVGTNGNNGTITTERTITTYDITNPVIAYTNVPTGEHDYYSSQTLDITYIKGHIENPTYYIKSSRSASTNINVLGSCGTDTNPGECSDLDTNSIENDIWYKVSGDINVIYNVDASETASLIALTYDGVNYSGATSRTVAKIEHTNPTAPVIAGGSNDWSNSGRTITVSEAGSAFSGIAKYQYYVSTSNSDQVNGDWADVSGNSVTVSTEGTHYVFFRTVSNAGNISDVSNSQTVKVDRTAPTVYAYIGKMMYTDPTFSGGVNSTKVYNNNGNGAVTHTRTSGSTPEGSYYLHIRTNGSASPGAGGFYFANQTYANKVFVTRIIARIPVGYNINWASNAYGNGGTNTWLTSQAGTGTWQEYLNVTKVGSSGSFSSTTFFYLTGPNNTSVEWDVAYATVFDTTAWSSNQYLVSGAVDSLTGLSYYGYNQSNTNQPGYNTYTNNKNMSKVSLITSNGTYYAWYKDLAGNANKASAATSYVSPKYTITLNNQSATSAGTTSIVEEYGNSYNVTTITKPTRTGYTFGGYYTSTNGGGTQIINASGTVVASTTQFSGNATIYAKWTQNCTFTSKDFAYTGGVQSWTVPTGCGGTYKLEVWGAQGGNVDGYTGGYGGYSTGNATLTDGQTIYIVVGQAGGNAHSTGGYNGGGRGYNEGEAGWGGGSGNAGGGATHIGKQNALLKNTSSGNVYIVAGGGGGAYTEGNGGAGGGTTGSQGAKGNASSGGAGGGTQSAGGASSFGSNGSYGQGGVPYGGDQAAGGGGGWYGGGCGRAAGGGSGYIGGVSGGSMSNGQRGGNGYARITKQ